MKKLIKQILPQAMIDFCTSPSLLFKSTKSVFTETYSRNRWNGRQSRSGTGSDLNETSVLIDRLPEVLNSLEVQSMLDIPCGDFNWMQHVKMESINYLGADIVEELIAKNSKQYTNATRRFQVLDLTKDKLPKVDLIFCRDCLVHLWYSLIEKAINNVIESKSKYVIFTTFTSVSQNKNILTGSWRPLNLSIAPFSFPDPVYLIDELYGELTGDRRFKKSLGVWKVDQCASFKL